MQIELSAKDIELSDAVREHVDRRLSFALGRFAGRFGRVRVRLEDDNGPKGGEDKRCRISVEIKGAEDVVVEEIDVEVNAAVSRAAERVGRTIARRLDKVVSARRGRGAPPAGEE